MAAIGRNGRNDRKLSTMNHLPPTAITAEEYREAMKSRQRPLTDRGIGASTASRRTAAAEASAVITAMADVELDRTEALEQLVTKRKAHEPNARAEAAAREFLAYHARHNAGDDAA